MLRNITRKGRVFFLLLSLCLMSLVLVTSSSVSVLAEENVIPIGYTAPFTGAAAEFGTNGWRGVQIALAEINEEGVEIGNETYQVEIRRYDSVCKPTEAVANMRKMALQDNVVAFLGDHCSSCCMAIAPLADQYQIPGLTIECAATKVTKPGNKYYFRMYPDMQLMVPSVAPVLLEELDMERVAFLGVNDDYGRSWINSFAESFAAEGVKVVAKQFFERGTTDFFTYLRKIDKSNPDVVGYVGVTPEASLIIEQANESGLRPEIDFFGSVESSNYELLNLTGAETIEGLYALTVWRDPPTFLIEEVRERFDAPIHYGIISGYDALHVIVDAIERAQSLDPKKIRDSMKAGTYETVEGFEKFRDFNGYTNQGSYGAYVIQWKDGERTPVGD